MVRVFTAMERTWEKKDYEAGVKLGWHKSYTSTSQKALKHKLNLRAQILMDMANKE